MRACAGHVRVARAAGLLGCRGAAAAAGRCASSASIFGPWRLLTLLRRGACCRVLQRSSLVAIMSAAEGGETGADAVPPSRMPAASVGTEPTDETAIQMDADNKGDATTPQEAAEDFEPPEIAPINEPPIHPGDLPVWLAAHLRRTKMARAGSGPFIVEFTGTLFLVRARDGS